MTETSAMNMSPRRRSWADGLRNEPAVAAALAIFLISAGTLAGAWYFQLVEGLPPCPLCLEERIPYHVIIPLSLLLAIAAAVRAPAKLIIVGFAVIAIAALANVVLGTYHAGVEWRFWPGPSGCTGIIAGPPNAADLMKTLQHAKVVACDEVLLRVLGLSLAGWNALISAALAALAVRGAFAKN